jgi:hypothetical protein
LVSTTITRQSGTRIRLVGETFLDWDYGHFRKADLLSRFTAYRQAAGGW